MAETITEMIIPATYIEVRAEGLIGVSGIATGNVGVVGTASKGPVGTVAILSSFSDARDLFGSPDPWGGGTQNELTLVRALQQAFANGASTVYAVRCAAGGGAKGFLALPNCTFNKAVPSLGKDAVFCDIEKPLGRHCATDEDLQRGIPLPRSAVALTRPATER